MADTKIIYGYNFVAPLIEVICYSEIPKPNILLRKLNRERKNGKEKKFR